MAIAATVVAALAAAPPSGAQGPARNEPCALADALRAAGEAKAARRQYVALMRRDPGLECARKGLAKLNRPAPDTTASEARRLCTRGDTYRKARRDDDALAAYKAALEKDPDIECARQGIEKLMPGTPARIIDDVPDVLQDAALVVGVVLVVLFVILLLGYVPLFHAGLVLVPGVGKILSPRLKIGPLEDASEEKVAKTVGARIERRLARISSDAEGAGAGHELDFGTPRETFTTAIAEEKGLKSALDKASEISPHAKAVAAILQLLYTMLPIRRLSVAGVLEPASESRAGLTLTLERDGTLLAGVTLYGRARTSPTSAEVTAADYVAVADAAAVWVQYVVARAIGGSKAVSSAAAESDALVQLGLDRQLMGEYVEARKYYEQAKELDPTNWTARLNLAMTEARLGGNYGRAIELLGEGFEAMQGPMEDSTERRYRRDPEWYLTDPDYYRLGFQLVAQLLNRDSAASDPRPMDVARQVIAGGHQVLAKYARRPRPWRRWRPFVYRLRWEEVKLQTFLEETVVPCTRVAEAVSLSKHDTKKAKEQIKKVSAGKLSYRVHYSLACWFGRQAALGESCAGRQALDHLSDALTRTSPGRAFDLADWAMQDPSLASVRDDTATAEEFQALIDRAKRPGQEMSLLERE